MSQAHARQTDGQDGRQDEQTEILPCVLQDIVPFGSAAQKGVSIHLSIGPLVRWSIGPFHLGKKVKNK